MEQMSEARFNSKVDLWLVLVIVGALVAIPVAPLLSPDPTTQSEWLLLCVVGAASAGLVIWIFTTTYYSIIDGQLVIVSGLLRKQVPLADICSVTPTHNPLASPALSLDRLAVRLREGPMILVSPKDKTRFIGTLKSGGAPI